MRKKKKLRGVKKQRVVWAVTAAIIISIILLLSFFIDSMLNQPSTSHTINFTSEPKAAIVDHLSLSAANQTFIQRATNILQQAGYTVDYYLGEKITVEFYRSLPTQSYELIIFRVHSALTMGVQPPLALFTSEPYDITKYPYEQLYDQVNKVTFSEEGETGKFYFGITPKFVSAGMKGQFSNTVIIMMGCDGLTYTGMAKAFTEKGAKVYISGYGEVSASHTDRTTAQLLTHLIIETQTVRQACIETMEQIGPDPIYNSLLSVYPKEAWDYTIPAPTGNATAKP